MSGDLDRLLTDAAAAPTRPVDADVMHDRAQRARRRGRLAAGLCAVVLVTAGTAAILAATGQNHRIDFGPADAPSGQAGQVAPGWPLRLRATAAFTGPQETRPAETMEIGGDSWDDWVAVTASVAGGGSVSVDIATADGRFGGGDDWVYSGEPFQLLEQAADAVASAPRQTANRLIPFPWWEETRPGVAGHPAPHQLLRPWATTAAAAEREGETAIEIEPEGAWAQRRDDVAARFDLDAQALAVRSWQTWPAEEECPADQLADCVRVTVVLLTDADVPLLVAFASQDGTTGELEVTHLDATRPQQPDAVEPRADGKPTLGGEPGPLGTAADPLHLVLSHQQVASAGQTITLAVANASDSHFSYGAGGALERWNGAEWEKVGDVSVARTWWESGGGVGRPGDPVRVPAIGYSASPGWAGEPEWLTLPALEPGWYQLVRRRSGGMEGDSPDTAWQIDGRQQAAAVFEVVAADEPREPVLAVPWEDPYLSLDVAAIGPSGGPLDMVPAQGSDVAGRSDAENGEGSAQLSRWEHGAWSSPQTAIVQLQPEEPVGNIFAVRADLPGLEPGFWRVQIEAADGGELTGYLWVVDMLGGEDDADSEPRSDATSEGGGTDASAGPQPAWTVLAADVATSPGVRLLARDANELAEAWAAASASTDPPAVPADSAVLVVSVPSSTCRARSDVLGVEVNDRTIVVVLDEDGEFTRPCPGPADIPRGTAFAVAVPLDAAPEHADVMIRTATR